MIKDPLTSEIIAAAYAVHNTLGFGFLEKVYENALAIELQLRGLEVTQQLPIPVYYEGDIVGDFYADLLVNDKIILELKSKINLIQKDEAQLVNYLKGTNKGIGLLINFGQSVKVKRKYLTYQAR